MTWQMIMNLIVCDCDHIILEWNNNIIILYKIKDLRK